MAEQPTSWTLIQRAATDDDAARAEFARRYEPVLRAYLGARWRGGPRAALVDDGVQDVFVECLRSGGVLERAERDLGGFRAFLYGVARRVALRHESRASARRDEVLPTHFDADAEEESLSRVFDRAWAVALLREAADLLRERAAAAGPDARRRVELLDLRFAEGLATREVAARWGVEPRSVQRLYERAREDFRSALLEVVARHCGSAREAAAEAERLLELVD